MLWRVRATVDRLRKQPDDGWGRAPRMASNPATEPARPRGNPAPAALLVAPDFVEPFLKACSPEVLLAACETCKAWLETATRDKNLLWRAATLSRYPFDWLKSDDIDDCEWLQRFKILSQSPPLYSDQPATGDEQMLAILKDLQDTYSFHLTARSLEAPDADDDCFSSGDFVFSLPLWLRMETLVVGLGNDGAEREVQHGLVLTTDSLDPPVHLPYRVGSSGHYSGFMARDFSIHVKRTKDRSIAQMVSLRGYDFYNEGDGYYHWSGSNRPAWLKCLTHGEPEAGVRYDDEFEPMLHTSGFPDDEDEDVDEDEGIRCPFLKFEFKRRTDVVDGPFGLSYTVPMCVRDMPDIIDRLTWS